jgi:protein-tyrosine phosphatase
MEESTMAAQRTWKWIGGLFLLAIAVIQFVPAPAVLVPGQLPAAERAAHRLLNFEGIYNFRDLGGYPAGEGQSVKWGVLYRTGTLAHASNADLKIIADLGLKTLVDFRSAQEKEEEPDRLPEPLTFEVVEIPTLDTGNETMVTEIFERIESGNFDGFDPGATMIEANRQFATEFTPQYKQFIAEVMEANGSPIVWHCSAGKDRAGFASAILLRILGVDQKTIMRDYMASLEPSLEARKSTLWFLRLFKGEEAAEKLAILMGVEEKWLAAGFAEIDKHWGSFDSYVRDGLGLSESDIAQLKANLLVSTPSPV